MNVSTYLTGKKSQVEWDIVSITMSSPSLVPFPRKSVAPWKSSKGGGPGDVWLFFCTCIELYPVSILWFNIYEVKISGDKQCNSTLAHLFESETRNAQYLILRN